MMEIHCADWTRERNKKATRKCLHVYYSLPCEKHNECDLLMPKPVHFSARRLHQLLVLLYNEKNNGCWNTMHCSAVCSASATSTFTSRNVNIINIKISICPHNAKKWTHMELKKTDETRGMFLSLPVFYLFHVVLL